MHWTSTVTRLVDHVVAQRNLFPLCLLLLLVLFNDRLLLHDFLVELVELARGLARGVLGRLLPGVLSGHDGDVDHLVVVEGLGAVLTVGCGGADFGRTARRRQFCFSFFLHFVVDVLFVVLGEVDDFLHCFLLCTPKFFDFTFSWPIS